MIHDGVRAHDYAMRRPRAGSLRLGRYDVA
jgi:hypothetical protein